MPCLLGCLALSTPRFVIILVVIFSDYIGPAYSSAAWPIIGFFLTPLTTLAYAWAWHYGGGSVEGIGLVVVVLAVLMDLGLLGGGSHSTKKHLGGRRNVRVVRR